MVHRGSGSSEFHYSFLINTVKNIITVECYISNNKDLFNQFYSNKVKIESIVETLLDWRELPEKKASRILIEKKVNLKDKNQWKNQFEWMKEMGIKFYKAFKSVE